MKQVVIELEEPVHEALKARAAANFRKIPQQLLFEALTHASKITGENIPARNTIKVRKTNRKGAVTK